MCLKVNKSRRSLAICGDFGCGGEALKIVRRDGGRSRCCVVTVGLHADMGR